MQVRELPEHQTSVRDALSARPYEGTIVRVKPSRGWAPLKLRELWQYRELVSILVWRDIEVVARHIEEHELAIARNRSGQIRADYGEGFALHRRDNLGDITILCGDPITLEFDIEAPDR